VRRLVPPALLVLSLLGLSLAWRYTALGDLVDLDTLIARAEQMRSNPAQLALAPLVFVALSVVLVPITLLRVTTVAGPRVQRIRERLHGGGALAVAALRLVPLGPFMVVNAACGAAGLHRRAFMLGTIIVMVPTLVVMALAVSWFPVLADWFLPTR
jgi:uncharacterized membrane protein YdjX (TVP38/TMEM64 family)